MSQRAHHLPNKILHHGSEGGGRRLVRRDGPLQRSPEGVLTSGDPRAGAQALRVELVKLFQHVFGESGHARIDCLARWEQAEIRAVIESRNKFAVVRRHSLQQSQRVVRQAQNLTPRERNVGVLK